MITSTSFIPLARKLSVSSLDPSPIGWLVGLVAWLLPLLFSFLSLIFFLIHLFSTPYGVSKSKSKVKVVETFALLSVPVVGATLGLIFKVLGEPIENLGPVDTRTTSPINGSAPAFIQLDTTLF